MTRKKLKLKPYVYIASENEVRRLVKDYLDIRGWYHFPVVQGYGSKPGVSDIVAFKSGRILFIELKNQSKRAEQSDRQIEFQKNVEKHGFEYILVKCLDDLTKRGV
jgi:Holliday junction resolvase